MSSKYYKYFFSAFREDIEKEIKGVVEEIVAADEDGWRVVSTEDSCWAPGIRNFTLNTVVINPYGRLYFELASDSGYTCFDPDEIDIDSLVDILAWLEEKEGTR